MRYKGKTKPVEAEKMQKIQERMAGAKKDI